MQESVVTDVEVAHESLIQHWDRLRSWLDETRSSVKVVQRVRTDSRRYWESGERQENLTLRGAELARAKDLLGAQPPRIGYEEAQFIRLCDQYEIEQRAAALQEAEEKLALQQRNVRLLRRGSFLISLLLACAVVFWVRAVIAERETRQKLFRLETMSGVGQRERLHNVVAAHHFARAATHTDDFRLSENRKVAASELLRGVELAAIFEHPDSGANGRIRMASFIEDNKVLTWSDARNAAGGTATGMISWGDPRDGSRIGSVPREFGIESGFTVLNNQLLSWSSTDNLLTITRLSDATTVGSPMSHIGVRGGAFIRDGGLIISYGFAGDVRFWNASTHESIPDRSFSCGDVTGLSFDDSHDFLLAWNDNGKSVAIWDVNAGTRLDKQITHVGNIVGARFLDDSTKVLSWCDNGELKLTDTSNGEATTFKHDARINGAVAVGDSSKLLSWANDLTARLWNLNKPAEPEKIMRHRDWEVSGASVVTRWRPNRDAYLSWGSDSTAKFWHPNNGFVDMKHDSYVRGAIRIPEQPLIVTWSDDGSVRLWRILSQEARLIGSMLHPSAVRGVQVRNREILSWCDEQVRLWRLVPQERPTQTHPQVRSADVNLAAKEIISWGAKEIAIGTESATEKAYIRRWSLTTGQEIVPAWEHNDDVIGVTVAPDGTTFSWSVDGRLKRWNSDGSSVGWDVISQVTRVVFDDEFEHAFAWNSDGEVTWVSLRASEDSISSAPQHGKIFAATFDDSEQRVVSVQAGGIFQWKLADAQLQTERLVEDLTNVVGVAEGDSSDAAVLWDQQGTVVFWRPSNGAQSLDTELDVQGGVLSPADEPPRVLLWSRRVAEVIDLSSGSVTRFGKHRSEIRGGRFLPGTDRVLTWSTDGSILMWDGRDGIETAAMKMPGLPADVVPSGDQRLLVAWNAEFKDAIKDDLLHLWDAMDGTLIATLTLSDDVDGCAFAGDGSDFVTWTESGTLTFWSRSQPRLDESWVPRRTGTVMTETGEARCLDRAAWQALSVQQ